jgi:UDP-N-acetylmuramate dehydrogenase
LIYTEELAKYKEWEIKGKLPAGKFIEEAGLKGMKIGGAQVSELHANFIINLGDATADDVMQLISLVKTRVRDEFNVQLEEEVQYVGF